MALEIRSLPNKKFFVHWSYLLVDSTNLEQNRTLTNTRKTNKKNNDTHKTQQHRSKTEQTERRREDSQQHKNRTKKRPTANSKPIPTNNERSDHLTVTTGVAIGVASFSKVGWPPSGTDYLTTTIKSAKAIALARQCCYYTYLSVLLGIMHRYSSVLEYTTRVLPCMDASVPCYGSESSVMRGVLDHGGPGGVPVWSCRIAKL